MADEGTILALQTAASSPSSRSSRSSSHSTVQTPLSWRHSQFLRPLAEQCMLDVLRFDVVGVKEESGDFLSRLAAVGGPSITGWPDEFLSHLGGDAASQKRLTVQ